MTFKRKRIDRRVWLVWAATLLVLSGWSNTGFSWGFDEDTPKDIIKSHNRHVVKEEFGCDTCHEDAISEDKANLPSKEICATCHEEVEVKDDKSACRLCHNATDEEIDLLVKGEKKVKQGVAPYKNLDFSHKLHADNEVKCKSCHLDIDKQKERVYPERKYMPKPETCIDCHRKKIAGFDPREQCDSCHLEGTFDRFIKPDFHRVNWTKYHGAASPMGLNDIETHGKSCYTCHTKNACVDCHNTQKPGDHNQFWRTRGHGFVAGGDRDRCVNCHKQDFCVSCHTETAPRTHGPSWGRAHCQDCHLESGEGLTNNCRVCHRSPAHLDKR